MNLGRPGLLIVLLPETAATLGLGFLIAWLHGLHPFVRVLFVPFGMAMMAMIHGLFFFTDGSPDIGMYMGFGMVAGLFLGTPLGMVLALIDWVAGRLSRKVPAATGGKDRHDQRSPPQTP